LEILEGGIPLHESADVWTIAVGLILIVGATMVWLTRPQE
jgi:hypothetical protein